MVNTSCGDDDLPIVFYTYDKEMMKHKDENNHDEDGKPILGAESILSPEVPFRIKAIYDYLRTTPADAPLLSRM